MGGYGAVEHLGVGKVGGDTVEDETPAELAAEATEEAEEVVLLEEELPKELLK